LTSASFLLFFFFLYFFSSGGSFFFYLYRDSVLNGREWTPCRCPFHFCLVSPSVPSPPSPHFFNHRKRYLPTMSFFPRTTGLFLLRTSFTYTTLSPGSSRATPSSIVLDVERIESVFPVGAPSPCSFPLFFPHLPCDRGHFVDCSPFFCSSYPQCLSLTSSHTKAFYIIRTCPALARYFSSPSPPRRPGLNRTDPSSPDFSRLIRHIVASVLFVLSRLPSTHVSFRCG